MKHAARLLKGSALQIFRDQMLLLLCIAPFLAGTAIRLVIPLIDRLLQQYMDFSLSRYYLIADAFTLTLGSMTIGIMVGLLMLDERDDGICIYYAVTPAGGRTYLFMRLFLPFVYSLITTLVILPFTSLGGLSYWRMVAPAFASSLNGIFMTMLMFTLASNKVEGLAVSKLLGIILFGIPLAWFANSYLKVIGYFLPTYWIMDMLIQAKADNIVQYICEFILSLLCIAFWMILLYRLFRKKLG